MNKTNRTRPKRHVWTDDDDALIVAQPHGGHSVRRLERLLHVSRERIEQRAIELGVVLRIKKRDPHASYNRRRKAYADEALPARVFMHDPGVNPYNVGEDRLLARLIKVHGKREQET